jgi:hypothetical protein
MPDPTPTPDPTPAPDPAPQPTPPADPPADPKPDDGKGGKDAILADLAKERDARQALQQQMTDLQTAQQQQMDALAKALGLKKDDTPPDPAALTAQIETEKANARRRTCSSLSSRPHRNTRPTPPAARLRVVPGVPQGRRPDRRGRDRRRHQGRVEADAVFKATPATRPPRPSRAAPDRPRPPGPGPWVRRSQPRSPPSPADP